ncbi:hypothetical protein ACERK3_09370 [Phycisphaerales bacterium AB-hyl4]|uniref:Uncharacterized protein n=1 Tax=Natronomicrosphaera hydrolytica TaxID=3242702 RepID=A0ABV4U4H1_9BACT
MGDELKRVRSGEPLNIPARAYNAFAAAADAHRRNFPAGGSGGQTDAPAQVLVRNQTGEDLPRFAVVGIEAPIIDPEELADAFAEQIAMVGLAPDEEDHVGRFAVLQEPAVDGGIAQAVVAGVTIVRVHVATGDDPPEYVDVEDLSVEALVDKPDGSARVLWIEDEGEERWAIVNLSPAPPSPLAAFRVTGEEDAGGDRVRYKGRKQNDTKPAAGYGEWSDDPNDTDEYDLYSPAEEIEPGSSDLDTDDIVFAVRTLVDGDDPEWWIVGVAGGGDALPEAGPQYQVLQSDGTGWHSDWMRLGPGGE